MSTVRASTVGLRNTAKLAQPVSALCFGTRPLSYSPRVSCLLVHQNAKWQSRQFSSSTPNQLHVKQWFPPPAESKIKYAGPAWPHPVYTEEQMKLIEVAHREAKTWQDKLAVALMRTCRWGMDLATGYTENTAKGVDKDGKLIGDPKGGMTERKWLVRIVFLESIAGVPGMVGGMLRHLQSLRTLKRDNGWIETLLEEAYNERMHLLTFLKIAEPGWFMKLMILGAQGVFFNGMFFSYLISPQTCHRFVGYLEEEAVYTYSRIIKEIEAGHLPQWSHPDYKIPDIAVKYWNMPEGKRTMKDLMLYVRADEAKHREVNHTLGNLNQKEDPNPFISTYNGTKPHPDKTLKNIKAIGWERDEVI